MSKIAPTKQPITACAAALFTALVLPACSPSPSTSKLETIPENIHKITFGTFPELTAHFSTNTGIILKDTFTTAKAGDNKIMNLVMPEVFSDKFLAAKGSSCNTLYILDPEPRTWAAAAVGLNYLKIEGQHNLNAGAKSATEAIVKAAQSLKVRAYDSTLPAVTFDLETLQVLASVVSQGPSEGNNFIDDAREFMSRLLAPPIVH